MPKIIPDDRIIIDDIETEKDHAGYERYEMTADQLTQLLKKKMIFINVQEEYEVGIVLVVRKQSESEENEETDSLE